MKIIFDIPDNDTPIKMYCDKGMRPSALQLISLVGKIIGITNKYDTRCSPDCPACNEAVDLLKQFNDVADHFFDNESSLIDEEPPTESKH